MARLERLTLPYFDSMGNVLQLWKLSTTLVVGAIKDKQQNLTIIPASRIRLLSEKQIDSAQIIHTLGRTPPQNWDIAFNPVTLEIDLWPHLVAAGKDWSIEVKESPFKDMTKEQVIRHLEANGFNNLNRVNIIILRSLRSLNSVLLKNLQKNTQKE